MAKTWTDEERKAFGEKMKAARQNKKLNPAEEKLEKLVEEEPQGRPETAPPVTIDSDPNYKALLDRIKELEASQWRTQGAPGNASFDGGKLTGTYEKYTLAPGRYPDPSARLAKEVKLQRFAFPMNYELRYGISASEYTTIDNIRTREPKFTLELIRIMMDEDTGEPTNGRYVICQLIMHEDPDAALAIARENGLEVDEMDEASFLNEMRYLRMRDWLLECFYPPKPTPESNKRDMVINGKLVSYFETNTESSDGARIDFSKLPRIKF